MSNCVKVLYDYHLVKKCSKCEIVKLKSNFLDYHLQFIKAYQFIKLNEERFNENIQ